MRRISLRPLSAIPSGDGRHLTIVLERIEMDETNAGTYHHDHVLAVVDLDERFIYEEDAVAQARMKAETLEGGPRVSTEGTTQDPAR